MKTAVFALLTLFVMVLFSMPSRSSFADSTYLYCHVSDPSNVADQPFKDRICQKAAGILQMEPLNQQHYNASSAKDKQTIAELKISFKSRHIVNIAFIQLHTDTKNTSISVMDTNLESAFMAQFEISLRRLKTK